jgi:steroid 5-alpha reductase family enzyme
VAILVMVGLWGIRLGTHLLFDRVLRKPEDGRYAALRQEYGASHRRRFFWFFQGQGAAAVFFSLPALIVSRNPLTAWHPVEAAAIALWAGAFAGEITADRQLARFKATHAGQRRPCAVGLWRYSRHPNYFFEWLIWVAFALFALGSPFGAVAIVCPIAMLYLLFRVTGIPLAEAQARRTRGDEYRRYQQTTSAFIPWFPSA